MSQGTLPAVAFSHVSRHFGDVRAVDDVSLDIRDGEFFTMLGPSGSGKTTFLRLVNQMETLTGGRIWVNSELIGIEERDGKLYRRKGDETQGERV